jgi:hypothetical protein
VEHELAATASATAWCGGQQPTCRSSSAYLFGRRRAGKQSLTDHSATPASHPACVSAADRSARPQRLFFFLTTLSSSSRAVLCAEQGPSKSNIPSAKRRKQHGLLTTSCVRSRSLLARPELASAHSSSETFFRFAGLALAVATPLLLTPRLAMRLAWYNHGARLVP